jgi:hypothetical protein
MLYALRVTIPNRAIGHAKDSHPLDILDNLKMTMNCIIFVIFTGNEGVRTDCATVHVPLYRKCDVTWREAAVLQRRRLHRVRLLQDEGGSEGEALALANALVYGHPSRFP